MYLRRGRERRTRREGVYAKPESQPGTAEVVERIEAHHRVVAAVLAAGEIPVDIRHEAKIDRAAVARWAGDVVAGRRTKALRRH